jgi:hypothetical protein|tara:strand:- start:223 stop:336 length:114 start_codon:yes stop_codon:yes gene_type:complete
MTIKVKEPQNPKEGEYSLANDGTVVVFKNGAWTIPSQ